MYVKSFQEVINNFIIININMNQLDFHKSIKSERFEFEKWINVTKQNFE